MVSVTVSSLLPEPQASACAALRIQADARDGWVDSVLRDKMALSLVV